MINRSTDKSTIQRIFHEKQNESSIVILYAKSGVGKSYFVDHVFSRVPDISFVRCSINEKEAIETKGLFISCMARSLDQYARQNHTFITPVEFINTIYTIESGNQQLLDDLLDIAAEYSKLKIVKEKIDKPAKQKKDILEKLLVSDTDLVISFLLEYINHVTLDKKLVLCIENIQQADKKFIQFLTVLLKKTSGLFIIAEFTLKPENELGDLYQLLPPEQTDLFELVKLEKYELLAAIRQEFGPEPISHIMKIIEESYDASDGNLVKLNMLLNSKRHEWELNKSPYLGNIRYDDAVHSVYMNLTGIQKLTLMYVVCHFGRVNADILFWKLQAAGKDISEFKRSLEVLKDLQLIKEDNTYLTLIHDSLFDLFKEEQDYFRFSLIAYNDWLSFYRYVTINSLYEEFSKLHITEQDIYIWQLAFILKIGGLSNIDWMNELLSRINHSVNSALSYSAVTKITGIFEQLIVNESNKLIVDKTFEWIVRIFYKLGHLREISDMCKRYTPDKNTPLLQLIAFSSRVASCDSSVKKDLLQQLNSSSDFVRIGVKLLLIRYFRTFSNLKEANIIWNELLKEKQSPYSAVILDQVNLCSFNFRKREKFLALSFKEHQRMNNNYHMIASTLNMGANAFYLHSIKLMNKKKFIDVSSACLSNAKALLTDSHYPLHVFQNQKIIHQLVDGRVPGDLLLNDLTSAYLGCGISGNKPLIGSNIIAVGLKENRLASIGIYVQELMEMSRKYAELNSEFSKYPLINCYNYYYYTSNSQGLKEVKNLLRSGSSFNNWGTFLAFIPFAGERILRKIKYYPSNIFNWDIDFEFLQNEF